MNTSDYLTIKHQELAWAKVNNKPMLVKILTEPIAREAKPGEQL